MISLSIVKTLVVLFYVGHISSWALKLPPASGDSLNRNTRQLVTCPGFAGYCSEAYPGDTCTVVCAFGRNNVPECQPDGTWSDNPRCIEHEPGLEEQRTKLCPGIPGYCSDSRIGTLCEFDCLIGADISTLCTEDGTWDPYPTCQGDIRETRDGCDDCPGPFGEARNREKEGGNSGKSNSGNRKNGNSGGRKSQSNGRNPAEASRRSGNGGNKRNGGNGGNRKTQGNGGNRRNQAGKKNNGNGGGARTQAETLAAKAGAVVPGKLPQGRRPPKPKNFDTLLEGNEKFTSNGNSQPKSSTNGRKNGNGNGNSQPKSSSNGRKNGNGNGRRNKPKSNSNGTRKTGNGSRNNRPSNNKRPKSISNNGSKRNQNKNGRPSNNRKQQNRNNNFGQKNKGGPSNQKPKPDTGGSSTSSKTKTNNGKRGGGSGGSLSSIPAEVQELAAKAGAIVPGMQPQGKLPPRKPGDDEKIARRLGQSSSSSGNGKRPSNGQNRKPQQKKKSGGQPKSGGCSESDLESCITACPSNIFGACAEGCSQRC